MYLNSPNAKVAFALFHFCSISTETIHYVFLHVLEVAVEYTTVIAIPYIAGLQ